MKLTAQIYNSPILTEGKFENVTIEETAITLKRQDSYLRIDFDMYVEREGQIVVLDKSTIAFQGMNDDEVSTNRTSTFKFKDDTEEQEPRPLIPYLNENGGNYPENYFMVDWGYPSYEDALLYLNGGSFQNPEISPVNEFVKQWILNTVVMKGEFIGKQFQFVE
ncbi:hypothetical protein [Flavobacterium praedii]|uniref:hypothetical protein n=1 Tax=Flavobacterium praedii TaxID=3002900 RepID=UPI0024820682|nr:hypothetical protein [Flavobacterium praedii]